MIPSTQPNPIISTHENTQQRFTWVRESDIIEQFDPDEDIDSVGNSGNKKKKHHTRDHRHNPQTERLRLKAVEEGRWALEEFEMQLNDTCGDLYLSDVDEEEEDGYSYEVLCQSDDEEDEEMQSASAPAVASSAHSGADDDTERSIADEEEITELLATEGMLDYSAAGRKIAKKRMAAIKKQKLDKEKAAQKKKKAEQDRKKKAEQDKKKKAEQDKKKKALAKQAKDELARKKKRKLEAAASSKEKASKKKLQREQQKQQKELEKRRKKRERERGIAEKKAKKARLSLSDKKGSRKSIGIPNKKERATAVVRGYLTRIARKEDLAGLGCGGSSSALPASAVEATGLLGMALAFRAAAGYVEMPVGKGEEPAKKPWDQIDTDGPAKAEDRIKNLEQQEELLEQEISRLERENSERRILIEQAHRQREANERKMIAVEERIKKVPEGVGTKKKYKPRKGDEESGRTTPSPMARSAESTRIPSGAKGKQENITRENDAVIAKDAAASDAPADQANSTSVEATNVPSTSVDEKLPAVSVEASSSLG